MKAGEIALDLSTYDGTIELNHSINTNILYIYRKAHYEVYKIKDPSF